MILFASCTLVYLLILLSIKPAPLSLKEVPAGFFQHAMSIRISLLLGPALLLIFLATSHFRFVRADPGIIDSYAMQGGWVLEWRTLLRILLHSVLHVDFQHLLTNVGALGLLSVYERRVGSKRFVTVLLAACLASAASAFFYPETTRLCGISGGLSGLAAAYFVDQESLTTRDWLLAIVFFTFVAGMLTMTGELHSARTPEIDFEIDHWGHALGVLGAVVYCRLRPLR